MLLAPALSKQGILVKSFHKSSNEIKNLIHEK